MDSDSDNVNLVNKLRIGTPLVIKHVKSLLANLMEKQHHIIK